MTGAPFFLAGAAGIELVLRATLLIAASWAAAAMLRKAGASAAARHLAWLLGIAALLALPFIWWLAPPLPLPILRAEAALPAVAALAPQHPAAPQAESGVPDWSLVLLACYAIGAGALLLRLALSRLLVSFLWRRADPVRDPAWQALLSRVSREMRFSRPVALRIARGPAMPMTWGTLAPKILLPAESSSWPRDRRRLVLLHELAHVARRDSLSRSAASLACALYWFHPGAWFAARQLRLEQEYAADDRVLQAGAGPRSYALSLLDLARRVGEKSWPAHAAAMAGMCQLERRVLSITTPAPREQPGPAFLSASAALAALVMLAVAAGVPVRPLPALPDPLGTATALPGTGLVPGPARAASERAAGMHDGAALLAHAEGGRPRDSREGYEPPRAAAPRADSGAPQGAQPAESAAPPGQELPLQSASAAGDGEGAPPAARQLVTYGPVLPRPIAEEQASDPRIPAALRPGNSGRAGSQDAARDRSRSSGGTLIRPRLILSPGQVWP